MWLWRSHDIFLNEQNSSKLWVIKFLDRCGNLILSYRSAAKCNCRPIKPLYSLYRTARSLQTFARLYELGFGFCFLFFNHHSSLVRVQYPDSKGWATSWSGMEGNIEFQLTCAGRADAALPHLFSVLMFHGSGWWLNGWFLTLTSKVRQCYDDLSLLLINWCELESGWTERAWHWKKCV